MSKEHTPGPWHFRTFHEDGIGGTNGLYNLTRVYVGSKEAQSSIWVADCGDDTDAERIANARLIAAAPDLLAACKEAKFLAAHGIGAVTLGKDEWSRANSDRNIGEIKRIMSIIDAAIAKAGGAT